jgi:hypothetical protein
MGVLHATPPDESFSVAGAEAWRREHTVSGGIAVFDDLTAGTDADTTMAARKSYVVDMTAWATADRSYTLPTDAVVGDRVAVSILVGNASLELVLKTGAGQTCAFSGSVVAAATEITRLFITGESMVFRYVAANKWMVDIGGDGRITQQAVMRLSTSAAAEAAATFTKPTDKSGVWTADVDNASVTTVATDTIKTRRAGNFNLQISGQSTGVPGSGKYFNVAATKNGVATFLIFDSVNTTSAIAAAQAKKAMSLPLDVDDTLTYLFRSEEGSKGLQSFASPRLDTAMCLTEVF